MKRIKASGVFIGVSILLIIILFPIIYVLLHSLKGEEVVTWIYSHDVLLWERVFPKPFYINLDQYYRILFRTPQYLYYFWNSIRVVIPIVFGQIFLAILAAYGFSKLKFWGSEVLFFLYIIIMLMPFQVTLVPNYIVLSKIKLLDSYFSLIMPGIFGSFATFFLKQFMEGIDQSFIEEGKILGASDSQILWSIIVPLCRPIIVSTAVLIFIDNWGMIEQPLIFIKSVDKMPLSVYLSRLAEENINVGFACSVIYMILPLLLILYVQDDLSDGLKITSLK